MRSKTLFRILPVLALVALLVTAQADHIMSATMVRKAVLEPLLLLTAGYASARPTSGPWANAIAPAAVAAATLLIAFWMIPHSVDLTQIHASARVFFVLSLFAAGLLLSTYIPALPRVASVAYAIYSSSMIAAVGVLYASQTTLWCSAYTLDDQRRFGMTFAAFGFVGYGVIMFRLPRWLSKRPPSP